MVSINDYILESDKADTMKVSVDGLFVAFQTTVKSHLSLFGNMFETYVNAICKEYGYKSSDIYPSFDLTTSVFTADRQIKVSPTPKSSDFTELLKVLRLNIENKLGYGVTFEKNSGMYVLTFSPLQDRDSSVPTIKNAKTKLDVVKIIISREIETMIRKLCDRLNGILSKLGYKLQPEKVTKFTPKIFNNQFLAKIQNFGNKNDSQFKLGRALTKNITAENFTFTISEGGLLKITLSGIPK